MPKVGSAPSLDGYSNPAADSGEESAGDFTQALEEVRAVGGVLEVFHGKGTEAMQETVRPGLPGLPGLPEINRLPDLPEPAAQESMAEREWRAASLTPGLDNHVDSFLVGYELGTSQSTRRRAAILLEQGSTQGEEVTGHTAELKA